MFEQVFFFVVFASITVNTDPMNDQEKTANVSGIGKMGEYYLSAKLELDDPSQLVNYGRALCREKEYVAAFQFLDKAIRIRPNVESFIERGKCYKKQGNLKLATSDFKEAISLKQEDETVRSYLIETYIEAGDWEEAAEETKKHISDHVAIVKFGNQFCDNGKYTAAIRCFNKALITEPEASYYKSRAKCYVKMGHLDKAHDDFEKGVELDPMLPPREKCGYDRVLLCQALIEFKKFDEAAKEIRFFESTEHITLVTDGLINGKKFKEAIPCYTAAIEKFPLETRYYENRGRCYREIRDFENAILDVQKAMELNPSCMVCCLELIEMLFKTERYEDARNVFKNKAELLASFPPIKQPWLTDVRKEIYINIEKNNQKMNDNTSNLVSE